MSLLPLCSYGQILNETPFAVAEAELNAPIPDAGTGKITDTITFPGEGLLQSIEVALQIDHPAVEELLISLRNPLGMTIVLHNQIPSGQSPFTPIYETNTPSAQPLSAFLDLPAQGDWTLEIEDRVTGRTGTLIGWGLRVQPTSLLTPPYPTPVPIESVPFTEQSRKAIAARISGGIATDMTGDTIDDLLLFSEQGDSVFLYRSDGNDLQEPPLQYTVAQPQAIAAGDINRDGSKDFVVASQNDQFAITNISVFASNQSGGYSLGYTAQLSTALDHLALLDITQDGILDIITGGSPTYLEGIGDGSFAPPQPLVFLGRSFWSHGDINQDGLQDLFVTISRGGTSPNADPNILFGIENEALVESERVILSGTHLTSIFAQPSKPGQHSFVSVSSTGEVEPTLWFSSVFVGSDGRLHVAEDRLAAQSLIPPIYPFDLNGDGIDEIIFANTQGAIAFQKTEDDLGRRLQTIFSLSNTDVAIPGLFFSDRNAGVALVSQNLELVLTRSQYGSVATPTPVLEPTPTPTQFLFVPSPTPIITPSPTATPQPPDYGDPDLDKNGIVDARDLLIFMKYWKTEGIK